MTLAPTSSRGSSSSGSLALITSSVLAAPGTFDFTGIAGTYSALRIEGVLRGAAVATNDVAWATFNADGGAHYGSQAMYASAGGAFADESNTTTHVIFARFIAADSAAAGNFSPVAAYLPDYASAARQKSLIVDGGLQLGLAGAGMNRWVVAGFWNQTAAITRVTITGAAAANFIAGSYLNLYGVT